MARYPVDLLWVDWFTEVQKKGGHAAIYVYHKNLLDHMGAHSSFSVRVDRPAFPACFESMADVWSLHTKEHFQARPNIGILHHIERRACALLRGRLHLFQPSWTD